MITQDSWKRIEETEIDLADLLCRLSRKWKQITVCALVFAVIAGGYSYFKNRENADIRECSMADDIKLTEEEQKAVTSAIDLQAEVKGLDEYLSGSFLMKVDPYHKPKVYMLYSIDHAKRQNVQKIAESYLSYVVNGGAADALKESENSVWDVDKSYLAEVITAYQRTYSSPYQVVVDDAADSSMSAEALFYVEITGMDEKMARRLAGDMGTVLEGCYDIVKDSAGSHRLTLLDTEVTVVADSNLQTLQHDKKAQLAANRASLKSMTDAFSDNQLAVYIKAAGIENEEMETGAGGQAGESESIKEVEDSGSSGIKCIFLGLIGGIFVYCCIFACCYLFRDTVKSKEEMKEIYTFPVYGSISYGKKEDSEQVVYRQASAQLLNRIRLACKYQGIDKFCAASDFPFDMREKECMEYLAGQLESAGIHTVIAENAGGDTALWDTLAETGTVLMVCRIGTTTHRMIDDAMRFYRDNGISVMGAMAFE